MLTIFEFLANNSISYDRYEHPAVFTCEEAEVHCTHIPGAPTKNLFLRDKSGKRHLLLTVFGDKRVDLKNFSEVISVPKLGFASAERLKTYLGVEPGSVTLLGLINDKNKSVEVFLDSELYKHGRWQCHPLVNTATLVISRMDLERFITETGHEFKAVELK